MRGLSNLALTRNQAGRYDEFVAVFRTDVLLADVRVWRSYPQIIHHAGWNRKGWTRIIAAAI